MSKSGGTLYIGVPPLQILGDMSPKVYASGDVSNPQKRNASPLSHLCYNAKFGHIKPYERNYGDPPEIFDPSRPAYQGHSRSLEPTGIDRQPMTSY